MALYKMRFMSDKNKISPDKIKFLQQWLIRQKNLTVSGYALAAIMLVATSCAVHDHQTKYAFMYSGIGLVDCIMADKLRKKHNEVRKILDDYFKNQK